MNKLLASGEKDLTEGLAKLKILLEEKPSNIEEINKLTHGLKGLFLNMGNHKVADKLLDFKENSLADDNALHALFIYLKLDKENTL